jgi:hypothetical protein
MAFLRRLKKAYKHTIVIQRSVNVTIGSMMGRPNNSIVGWPVGEGKSLIYRSEVIFSEM